MFSASRAAWSLITRHDVSTPFFLCDLGSKVFASTVAARNRDTEPMTLPPHLRHMNTAIGPSMRPKSRKSVSPAFLATQNPQSIDWKRDSGPRLRGRVGQPRPALLPTPPLSRSLSSSSIFSSRRSVTKRRKRPFSTDNSSILPRWWAAASAVRSAVITAAVEPFACAFRQRWYVITLTPKALAISPCSLPSAVISRARSSRVATSACEWRFLILFHLYSPVPTAPRHHNNRSCQITIVPYDRYHNAPN